MIVAEVDVKMAVQPWLQKSAVANKERLRSRSSNTCTLVVIGGIAKVPVAFERMLSPLGSPTDISPPALRFCKHRESDLRRSVFVAPVSWIAEFL